MKGDLFAPCFASKYANSRKIYGKLTHKFLQNDQLFQHTFESKIRLNAFVSDMLFIFLWNAKEFWAIGHSSAMDVGDAHYHDAHFNVNKVCTITGSSKCAPTIAIYLLLIQFQNKQDFGGIASLEMTLQCHFNGKLEKLQAYFDKKKREIRKIFAILHSIIFSRNFFLQF